MATLHTFLDAPRLASLAQDPDWSAAEAAMRALRKAQAAHPAMKNRPVPEPDPLQPDVLCNCTSLQPLGGASVMVCYDESDGIEVTGVDLPDGFVEASEFAPHVVARWERDIAAELARDAEMARWDR